MGDENDIPQAGAATVGGLGVGRSVEALEDARAVLGGDGARLRLVDLAGARDVAEFASPRGGEQTALEGACGVGPGPEPDPRRTHAVRRANPVAHRGMP